MRVIIRLARRHINRRFLQSALFVIGVALGVAMIIAIDVANSSANRAFTLSTESISGRATHQIISGSTGIPSEVYSQLRTDLGLQLIAPIVTEYVRIDELGNRPLQLLGIDPFAEPPFRPYLANANNDDDEGVDFEALTAFISAPNTILISAQLANTLNISAGDTIILRTGTNITEVEVVGTLQPDDSISEQALNDLILADIATAQEITETVGRLSRIDLILDTDTQQNIIDQIQQTLPEGTQLRATSESDGTLAQMTAAFELNLQALSLLALVVGVFLIYNTVTFSVVQRRPVIGIMRSIGTSKRQIFALVLGEAVLLGIVGTVLGLGLGIIFGRGAVGLVSRTISDLYFTINVQSISVETFTLIKGSFIGVFASVGAALIPAWDATRTTPAGVLRRSDQESRIQRLLPWITIAAFTLNVIGLLLLQIPSQSIVLSFTALFFIVVGSSLFTPIVLVLFMRFITPLTEYLFGILGRMAPRAINRSLSRTSIAVAALTIAVSVIVGVSVMISSFRNTVDDWLSTTLGADIYVSPVLLTSNNPTVDTDPIIRDIIANIDGVDAVSTSRTVTVITPDYPDLPDANLIAVDYDIAEDRTFVWNIAPDGDHTRALQNGAIMVSEPFAFRRNITPENNQLDILTDEGVQTFDVIAVYYDYSTDQGSIFMLNDLYRTVFDDAFITSAGVFIEENADIDAVIGDLRQALSEYDLQVQANRELRSGVFEVFDNAFAITVALRLLATVVAFIGILSALLSLQLENIRQYGIMRAVGLTPRQLWQFTFLQTGLMGIVAGLLALPIGLALAMVLLFVINVRSFGWTMQFYLVPEEFIIAFTVAVVAALLAGIIPAWRLKQLVTARALRSE